MQPTATLTCSRYFTVAMAGHVDHGKTSLIKQLTGTDPDRLKEEKERQMTTDVGFAHLLLPEGIGVGFIDVPGHGKFLKNMLAGVGAVDLALLVVAADEGPMPQTRQHVRILSLLGISRVLVAITKLDLVAPAELEDSTRRVRELLTSNRMTEVGCIPLSCTQGTGFDRLPAAIAEALASIPERDPTGAAFLPIDRVFTKAGHGTVVTGTLVRGSLSVGDHVTVEPGGMKARVRRLESLGQPVSTAGAGQRVAANLVIKDGGVLKRGHVLLAGRVGPVSNVMVSLSGWGERVDPALLTRLSGQDVRFYHGTAESHGHLRWLEVVPTSESEMTAGSVTTIAQVALAEPVVAEPGDRFVVRLADETIYGGTILIGDRPRWLTRERLRELMPMLSHKDYKQAAISFISMAPQRMVPISALDRFLPSLVRQTFVEELTGSGFIVRLADHLLTLEAKEQLCGRLHQLLRGRRSDGVDESGPSEIPLEQARRALGAGVDRSVFQSLIQEMVDASSILRRGDKLTLPEAAASKGSDARIEKICQGIEEVLATNFCLEITELAALLPAKPQQVRLAIERLANSGRAHVVGYDYACLASNLEKAHGVLSELWHEKRDISPGEFRERLGTSRKYAMALLAYLDDRHITRRLNNSRVLLKQPGT